ncbi:DUF6311 domain-containing protein [Sphingomonas sp.]|uniref:DUF6311 domain-containing protein n=1 Tax=Sphingomonas sp. TaxID=28214 RepID=UPI001DB3715A|nr:DUF6311 domain-containing protein [Sphingomonas sp.]MBX9797020.1 hypothetical protein [Sphingomonas sp.]
MDDSGAVVARAHRMRHAARMAWWLPRIGTLASALLLFALWMHPAVLDPLNAGWLLTGSDRGQTALGLAAYLRGGGWPGLSQQLLMAPEGTSLLLTDSIPLLGVLVGPFARWLPPGVQLVGLWYLACVLLQFGFAWALIRPRAPDGLSAWAASLLLAAAPVLLNRYIHPSLCAHWLLLWALWIYVEPARAGRIGWWLAVLGVTALVHNYLLLMVAAIWAGHLLERLAAGGWRRVLVEGALGLALVAAIIVWLGVAGLRYPPTGTYGAFPMALDGWVNPANPSYSVFLPSSPEDRGRGYEGFQYLGAGLIGLAVVALIAGTATAPTKGDTGLRRLGWLVPGFAVLALLAFGHHWVIWGQTVVKWPLPPAIVDALDPVRASGRLFWPITYCFVFMVLALVLRMKAARLLLAAALAVQMLDLSAMLAAIRPTSARAADATLYQRTRDPRWAQLIAGARAVDFMPASVTADLQLMHEVSWRAVLAGKPVGFTYTARLPGPSAARLAREARAFAQGQVAPGHLVVLLGHRVPAIWRTRVQRIDGVPVIIG